MMRRLFIATCCLCFSLSTDDDRGLLLQNDKLGMHNQDVVLQSVMIIDVISTISDDEKLSEQLSFFLATYNQVQRFVYLSAMIDRSLKDFKKICLWNDITLVHDFLYQISDYYYPTVSFLLSMQRYNRSLVKNIIQQIENIPDSDRLQMSLQQLFHALHEVKKEIITIDKVSVIHAWYIYVTLLFLHDMLIEGVHCIDSTMDHKVDQQVVIHQMLYLSERFKRTMVSGLTITRGYNEKI